MITVNRALVLICLLVAFVTLVGSGIAATAGGIKMLRNRSEAVPRSTLIWLYAGIAALVFSGVAIFFYGR